MQTKNTEKYFFFSLLFLTFIFAFLIFRPFLITLILGASFAIVLRPVHRWLQKHKFSNWLSSLITVFVFLILICGPLFTIGITVFNQSQNLYEDIINGNKITPFLNNLNYSINNFLPNEISFDLNQKISELATLITKNVGQIFSSTLSAVFSFFLMILAIFYFLKNGSEWKKSIISLSPMSDENVQSIISKLKDTINGVIRGNLFIALLQGILMGIGLMIFGVPNPALWGIVASLASMIPSIGTAFISVPAIIFLYATGNVIGAVGLLIWAVLLVGLIDNLLSPFIISKKTKMPEFVILFAVLGGITLLGPVGILVGPLTVSLLYTLVSIYRKEFKQNETL